MIDTHALNKVTTFLDLLNEAAHAGVRLQTHVNLWLVVDGEPTGMTLDFDEATGQYGVVTL